MGMAKFKKRDSLKQINHFFGSVRMYMSTTSGRILSSLIGFAVVGGKTSVNNFLDMKMTLT